MAGKGARIAYWDSCIFIAWLTGEATPQRTQSQLDGIKEQAEAFDKGELYIATSVLTLTEVLDAYMTEEQRKKFQEVILRRNFYLRNLDGKISMLAREIRDYYQEQKKKDNIPTLSTPDSIQLASAIFISNSTACDTFYTFDRDDVHGDGKRAKRGLLPLSGNVAGKYPLIIKEPAPTPQENGLMSLFDEPLDDSTLRSVQNLINL